MATVIIMHYSIHELLIGGSWLLHLHFVQDCGDAPAACYFIVNFLIGLLKCTSPVWSFQMCLLKCVHCILFCNCWPVL